MKKINKIFFMIALIFICILVILNSRPVYAVSDLGDKDIDTNVYRPDNPTREESREALGIAGKVLAVIINLGLIMSVIMVAVIGLKYMLSSPSEKAEYMKSMLPLLVGAVILVSSVEIVKLIYIAIGD